MNVRVHIDAKAFKNKPNKDEIRQISTRIVEGVEEVTIKELATYVGEKGHTFMPAIMCGNRKTENFCNQQVFALDFDEDMDVEKFIARAKEFEVAPAFLYETFSSTEDKPKFRAVFVNDCVFENQVSAEIMTKLLMELFPEADTSCKDVARMFFGGKKLLYLDDNAEINIKDIAVSVEAYVKKQDSKNYSRKIEQIGRKIGVKVSKGSLHILFECMMECEENQIISNRNILGKNLNSSKLYYYTPTNAPEEYVRHSIKNQIIQYKTQDDIKDACQLYKDFCEQEVSHNHKFLLATNLAHIKGGKTMFFSGVIEHREKWEADWRTIIVHEYEPQSCVRGGCPYIAQCKCKNLCEKLQRKVTLHDQEEKFLPLKEGERLLKKYLNHTVDDVSKDIAIIKAQTSIGKTRTYCQMVQERGLNKKPILIAAPSVKLQEEIYENLTRQGVNVHKTISLKHMLPQIGLQELGEEIQELYERGFGFEAKGKVRLFVRNSNNKLYRYQKEMLEAYLDGKNNSDGTKPVVTTHAMFMALPEDILKQYEVIVDEDILFTNFKNTSQISFDELSVLCNCNHISAYHKIRIQEILNLPEGTVQHTGLSALDVEVLKRIYQDEIPIEGSVADFFESSTIYINVYEQCVNFFNAKKLPNVSMTIVSATINRELCEKYFAGRKVEFYEIPLIKYTGKLKQYTAYSMSRSFINGTGWDFIKNGIEKVIGGSLGNTVTFKMIDETKEIYFGKSEGFNGYQGQDLCVIGTPHNVPFIYRLIGKHLGYRVDENMCRRRVQNDWCSFQIMTFESKDMQNLQFYFLESELEQSIGRARLLRNDCTVYLFSNYPCRQAEIIQDDYLCKNKSSE